VSRVTTAFLALVAILAPVQAQTQTKVAVDGKDYTVTELPGRTMHMVQLSGPEGTAMIAINTQNQITMYLNPPGGGAYKSLIDEVWGAYIKQKSGNAASAPAGQSTPASDTNDPNAALRAQAAALAAATQQRAGEISTPANAKPHALEKLTADGAVVSDPKLGDVTISDNGMKFEWTVKANGAPPAYYTVYFEGGEKEAGAGAKTGKLFKGLGTAIGNSENTHADAASSITTNTDVWRETEKTGKKETKVYESGGYRTGGYVAYSGRDPIAQRAVDDLYNLLQDLNLAKDAIAKAQGEGQTISFDVASDRFQRGYKALQDATSAYAPK
jgi:hypothetical protein